MKETINGGINEIEQAIIEYGNLRIQLVSKISKIKIAIDTLEKENIALPETAYGTLAYYQSKLDNTIEQYNRLINFKDKYYVQTNN